jgi:hypothetical protein
MTGSTAVLVVESRTAGESAVETYRGLLQAVTADPTLRSRALVHMVGAALEDNDTSSLNEHVALSYMLRESNSTQDVELLRSVFGAALTVTGKRIFAKRLDPTQRAELLNEVDRKGEVAPKWHFKMREALKVLDERNTRKLEQTTEKAEQTQEERLAKTLVPLMRKLNSEAALDGVYEQAKRIAWKAIVAERAAKNAA